MVNVVIATKDREYSVVTSILSLLYGNKTPLKIYVVDTSGVLSKSVELKGYFGAFYESIQYMNFNHTVILREIITDSVAHARASIIKNLKSDCVFMCDDDDLAEKGLVDELVKIKNTISNWNSIGAIAVPFFETLNCPNYDDWDNNRYSNLNEVVNKHGKDVLQFHLYDSDKLEYLPIDHISTHALWNTKVVSDSGVLDLWLNYPDKTPMYDYYGSKMLYAKGYDFYLLTAKNVFHLKNNYQNDRFWDHNKSFGEE